MKYAYKPTRDLVDQSRHYFSGLPEFWSDQDIKITIKYFGSIHDEIKSNGTELHFMGYYKFWDPQKNFY